MKLWIDDIRTPPDESWHICRSALSAINALFMFQNNITEIRLDHDISHQVVIGKISRPYPCEETFMIVAHYMRLLKRLTPDWTPKITIHTSNPIGGTAMKALLLEVGLDSDYQIAPGANRLEMIL